MPRLTVGAARRALEQLASFKGTCCICGGDPRRGFFDVIRVDLLRAKHEFRVCRPVCAYELGCRTAPYLGVLNR